MYIQELISSYRQHLKKDSTIINKLWQQLRNIVFNNGKEINLQTFVPDYFLSSAFRYIDEKKGKELKKILEDAYAKDPTQTHVKEKLDYLKKGERNTIGIHSLMSDCSDLHIFIFFVFVGRPYFKLFLDATNQEHNIFN